MVVSAVCKHAALCLCWEDGSSCRPHLGAPWLVHAGEGDDKYLIATSEQTLCAMHRKGWFEKQELPVK